jgi:uncharacterized protein
MYEDGTCKTVKSKPPLVIYHSPCLDGFTAAWAMWFKYPDAEFVPGVYGQDEPDCLGRDVVLLDFSYKRNVMDRIIAVSNSVTVLDHHKTAQTEMDGLAEYWRNECPTIKIDVVFDMHKSGARLAWEHFHPDEPVPRIVKYVEDRDLWRFAYHETRAINAALFSYEYNFDNWSRMAEEMERSTIDGPVGIDRFVTEGAAIERKHHKDIAELVPKLRHKRLFTRGFVTTSDYIPCINLPYTYASDAGNMLAQGVPFAAVYYQDADGYQFSLRSIEGGTDVSEVAKRYGGGGHKHAAGFRVKSLEEL